MELDRQSIEKRDFPIGRRGYDPAAVDAHLRDLAIAVEELGRTASRGADSLAATAGTQVQAIVAAAEAAAAEIESDARASAERVRAQAQSDAEQTRADAIAKAQAHVAAVGRATAKLLERVQSMDGETGALVDSLRTGATRLTGDLAAVESNMGELYDAASGRASGTGAGTVSAVAKEEPAPERPPHPDDAPPAPVAASSEAPTSPPDTPPAPVAAAQPAPVQSPPPQAPPIPQAPPTPLEPPIPPAPPPPTPPVPSASPSPPEHSAAENGDLDGARLVALNMALNGDSREEADRYLAENYEVADRAKLLDEVYAAIEG